MPAPSAGPEVASACAALIAALPVEVDPGVERRPVSDGMLTAAWGDPPVTLACGVPLPDRPEERVTVNDVVWSVRDIGAGFRWTTLELTVPVAVEIPDVYSGAEIVNPLTEPLLAALGRDLEPSPEPS